MEASLSYIIRYKEKRQMKKLKTIIGSMTAKLAALLLAFTSTASTAIFAMNDSETSFADFTASVCASEPIQLNAWSAHVVAVETSVAMEGRSSTWFASAAQSLNATTPRGTILVLW